MGRSAGQTDHQAQPGPAFALSERVHRTQPQPVAALLAAALDRPEVISLAVGFVDDQSLPTEAVTEAVRDVLADPDRGRAALQYGTTPGLPALRRRVVDHVAGLEERRADDLRLTPDRVVITTGSQQALHIVADVLLDPGDIVLVAAPSYFVYTAALTSFGVEMIGVPMDGDGMRIDALEKTLADLAAAGRLDRVKMVYVMTYFQNPTGLCLSVERRRAVLEVVGKQPCRHRILVLEDAAYRELRFDGPETPSVRSFDTTGETVAMAVTFSKSLCPGMRLGALLLPTELVAPVLGQKGHRDFGSPNLLQHALVEMLASGAYGKHVAQLRDRYRRKRDTLLEALRSELADLPDVRWTEPEGGLYVWLTLPEDVAAGPGSPLLERALSEGVLYVPGEYCFVASAGGTCLKNSLRLSYGLPSETAIAEGVRRLGRALRAVVEPVAGQARTSTRSTS